MDHILYSTFLDDRDVAERIYALVTDCLLGPEQAEKIRLRYYDMYRNFFKYSKEESIKYGCPTEVWEFSKGVEPFKPKGWDRYYEDTITVPVPITHPDFKDLTERTEKRGAIGLDLPTWFNLKGNDKRVMLIAQDPLRNNWWYSDADPTKGEAYICTDALLASPFGLHGRSWRENKRGGGRIKLLVEKLIVHGYGVYLTDCRKYFVYDHKESAAYTAKKRELYKRVLEKEIEIIRPTLILAMGNEAYAYCKELLGDQAKLKYLPHFSGAATWKAKAYFGIPKEQKMSVEELADTYVKAIIEGHCEDQ